MKREQVMKIRVLVACAGLLLVFAGVAYAVKLQVQVSPQSAQESGFSVTADSREEGLVDYTITRDLSKVRAFPADSSLEIRRFATLEICGDSGLIARCQIEAEREKDVLTYRFTLARSAVAHSHFTVAEIDDYKNTEGREHLLGGGTFYEVDLVNFPASL